MIKRYELTNTNAFEPYFSMEEDTNGEYVLYSDYATLYAMAYKAGIYADPIREPKETL